MARLSVAGCSVDFVAAHEDDDAREKPLSTDNTLTAFALQRADEICLRGASLRFTSPKLSSRRSPKVLHTAYTESAVVATSVCARVVPTLPLLVFDPL